MRITLHLSGGLRAVLDHLPEKLELTLPRPARVGEILIRAGINPLLAMLVTLDGEKADLDHLVKKDGEMVVTGPAAGG